MSMTISTGDDRDDELEDRRDVDTDDDRDDDDDRPARRPAARDEADDEPESDDEDDDRSPEDLRAEIKRLRASLSKANSSGQRRRQQLKELRAANASLSNRDDDEPDESDDDGGDEGKPAARKPVKSLDARAVQRRIDKARKEERAQLEEEHKRDLIETRAENAFTRAGVSEKNFRLLKRELDLDEIDFDPKTRRVDGLEDEIDRLRGEFPDLFRQPKTARRRVNGGDDRDGEKRRRPLSATERQVASLQGRS